MSDDNKVKLLKIQHALLAALAEKEAHAETEEIRNQITHELSLGLLKYKELVTDIENSIYLQLQNKITILLESSLTLEEELDKLEEIENFYNQLIEIQTRFKQTYNLYSDESLTLSDINRLNIEKYLKRQETIKAYLINKKNIAENKNKIEKINEQLIDEEQKETRINKKITFLDEEIIRRLISSEGRLLLNENNQETLKYTSISNEYQSIGITIDKNGYTGNTLEEITNTANETKEKLTAATISYEVLPSIEKKKILDEIYLENTTANYHLVMAKLLIEFYSQSTDCSNALQKREHIKDLLKYRQTYLTNLGIKFAVDPFSRLHINEQIEELKQYESNSRIIAKLRHEIAELNTRIETLEADNIQNLIVLENSEKSLMEKELPQTTAPSFNDYIVDIKPAEVRTLDNQVVNIRDLNYNFNHKKCQEVTKNVIKKVYEVLVHPKISKPTQHAPELVIEQSNHKIEEPLLSKVASQDKELTSEIFAPVDTPFIDNKPTLPIFDESKSHLVDIPEIVDPSKDWNPELVIEPMTSIQSVPAINEEKSFVDNSSNLEKASLELSLELSSNEKNEESQKDLFTLSNGFDNNNNSNISSTLPVSNLTENSATIEFPDLAMPTLEQAVTKESPVSDIFSEITPFESPTMFTEKVDSVEPEKTFSIPIEKNTQPLEMLGEMTIKLDENSIDDTNVDFWTTDADINNIANESTVYRKGM